MDKYTKFTSIKSTSIDAQKQAEGHHKTDSMILKTALSKTKITGFLGLVSW